MPINKQKILKGRDAVEAYRTAHAQLYAGGWYKGISEDHTPLQDTKMAELERLGFNTADEFYAASEALNLQVINSIYRREGECDGCPSREKSCRERCFAARSVFSEEMGRPTLTLAPILNGDFQHYVRSYGLPKGDGVLLPNCKFRYIKIGETDIDWLWG